MIGKTNRHTNWFAIEDTHKLETPVLVVYFDRVTENIQQLKNLAGDVTGIRPHIETSKMPGGCKFLPKDGMTWFKFATIDETEMLAQLDAPDVLLDYSLIGPDQNRLLQLLSSFPITAFSCLVSQYKNALALSEAAREARCILKVYKDIDADMHLRGIVPEKAGALYLELQRPSGLEVMRRSVSDENNKDMDAG